MNRNLKRYLSVFLVLVMCMSLMPVSAMAEEEELAEEPVHEHVYEAVVTPPTCTEQGYTTYICECGDSYLDDFVEPTGHTPVIVAEVPATEKEPGTAAGTVCEVCGEVLEGCEEIPVNAAEDVPEENLPETDEITGVIVSVFFDPQGGECGLESAQAETGKPYGSMPLPCRDGYCFDGWYTAPEDGSAVRADTVVTNESDHTLYAHWITLEPGQVEIFFDFNDGVSFLTNGIVTTGQPYGYLPCPERDGYTFDGWWTARDGGTQVFSETTVTATEPHTLYAHWLEPNEAMGQNGVTTYSALQEALNEGDTQITIGGNIVIPSNAYVEIGSTQSVTVATGCRLTLGAGADLYIFGNLTISAGASLLLNGITVVYSGGTINGFYVKDGGITPETD